MHSSPNRPVSGPPERAADGFSNTCLGVVILLVLLLPGPAPPAHGVASVGVGAALHTTAAPASRESEAPSTFVPKWSWPLKPVPAVVRRFEKPPQNWNPGHRGVDLSIVAAGSDVLSPADGVVSFAGTVVDRGVVSIDHGGGRISSFEPVTTTLSRGQPVAAGDVVGTVSVPRGSSSGGHCGRPCLHWGVRVAGHYVDPLSFVLDRRPSVLLPLGRFPPGDP